MEIVLKSIVYVILGTFACICILGWWIAGGDRAAPKDARPVRNDELDTHLAAVIVLSSQDAGAISHAGASYASMTDSAHCTSDDGPQPCDCADGSC